MSYADVTRQYGPPIVVGGVGGSGTRLIAALLQDLGVYQGADLNQSLDNLTATLLFRRADIRTLSDDTFRTYLTLLAQTIVGQGQLTLKQRAHLLRLSVTPRVETSRKWLLARAKAAGRKRTPPPSGTRWGWKEPANHFIVGQLLRAEPNLNYINVVRSGLDLAFSPHQKGRAQLARWSNVLLGETVEPTPRNNLRFWCAFQREAAAYSQQMGDNFLQINFDQFCANPDEGIQTLAAFVSNSKDVVPLQTMRDRVQLPRSIGRFREYGTADLGPADVAYVQSHGFDIE